MTFQDAPTGDEMLKYYSLALDEIFRLRTALAYEAGVIKAHLDYRTFPQGRRYVAEQQVERMRASAQGRSEQAYAETSRTSLRHVRQQLAIETLTRGHWEVATPRTTDSVYTCAPCKRAGKPDGQIFKVPARDEVGVVLMQQHLRTEHGVTPTTMEAGRD